MQTLIRFGFAALIVCCVAIQLASGLRVDPGDDPVATLAKALERLNVQTVRTAGEDVLIGHTPSCEQPIHVALLRIDGGDDERLGGPGPDDDVVRYVYFGAIEAKPNRVMIVGRWLWARARFIAGLSSANARSGLVAVGLPRACPGLLAMDWAALSPAN